MPRHPRLAQALVTLAFVACLAVTASELYSFGRAIWFVTHWDCTESVFCAD